MQKTFSLNGFELELITAALLLASKVILDTNMIDDEVYRKMKLEEHQKLICKLKDENYTSGVYIDGVRS